MCPVETSEARILEVKYQTRLKALITIRGFKSMLEFARAIGVSQPTISQIIRGYALPTPGVLNKICAGLEIGEDEFVELLVR
jgi:transcriptional regulator with XRE-family HTH domain